MLHGTEYEVDSRDILRLVCDSDCSAYDCEFVGLALMPGVELVTMDGKVLRSFPEVATPMISG